MSTHQVSRRTLARGAAWTVPVVAIGVAAPAFALSLRTSVVTDPGKSCKCPGGGSPWTYNLNLAVTTPGPDSYTLTISDFKVDNLALVAPAVFVGPSVIPLAGGEGNPVLVRFRSTNSNSTHDISFTVTPTNTTTGEVGASFPVSLPAVKFDPCKTGDNYSCA